LVLDDVWREQDAHALKVGGPQCRVLLTTRNAETVPDAQLVQLDVMQRNESRTLLRQASGGHVDEGLADQIAERLGDHPLALSLVAGQLRANVPWVSIEVRLQRHDFTFGSRKDTVFATMASSVEALPKEDRIHYEELVIFPDDVPLDPAAVARLWGRKTRGLGWGQPRPLGAEETSYLLGRLRVRSLLQSDDTLHDLQLEYLRHRVSQARQAELHWALAAAYGGAQRWPLLPKEERYAWKWLMWHLLQAHRVAQARQLATDARYLERKIGMLGTEAAAVEGDTLPRQVQARKLIIRVVLQLPPQVRETWVLSELHGFTRREIAQILAVNEETISKRLYRARTQLLEWSGDDGAAGEEAPGKHP
jgi:RNA polymerase sigma factor (sigma-70 family)